MLTPPIELKLMKYFPQVMRWPITRGFMRRKYRRQIGPVSHVGIISGEFFDDAAAVRAGGFLCFWLELGK